MKRHVPGLAELAAVDGEELAVPVEDVIVERECLGNAHSRDEEQTDDRRIPRGEQRLTQGGRFANQHCYFVGRIEVRRRTLLAARNEVSGRHLRAWVNRVMVSRKEPDGSESMGPPGS